MNPSPITLTGRLVELQPLGPQHVKDLAEAGADPEIWETAIGKLWSEAEVLNARLDAYRAEIAAAAQNGGISGWMRLGGEASPATILASAR